MKKTLYQEQHIDNILLKKNLLSINYTKALIRLTDIKEQKKTLDSYIYTHKTVGKQKQQSLGFKVKYAIRPHSKSKLYNLIIPNTRKKEIDYNYAKVILSFLQYIRLSINKDHNLKALILRPSRSFFKAYCFGIIGLINKKFLLKNKIELKSPILKSRGFFKALLNQYVQRKLILLSKPQLKNQNFCVLRINIFTAGLRLKKTKRAKFKYIKNFWLHKKKKKILLYRFLARFKTKSLTKEVFRGKRFLTKLAYRMQRRLLKKSRRKMRRKSFVKYWSKLSKSNLQKALEIRKNKRKK